MPDESLAVALPAIWQGILFAPAFRVIERCCRFIEGLREPEGGGTGFPLPRGARRFFSKITPDQVRYDVSDSYGKLIELVK